MDFDSDTSDSNTHGSDTNSTAAPFDPSQLTAGAEWLSQRQIAELFGTKTSIVADLIRHLYKTGELDKTNTVRKQRQLQQEGKRQVERELNCYSRSVVLAVGSRVHSARGEQFRAWSNELITTQLEQGYYLDQRRLMQQPERLLEIEQQLAGLGERQAAPIGVQLQGEYADLLHTFLRAMQRLGEAEVGSVALRNATLLAPEPLDYMAVQRVVAFLREQLFADAGDAGQFGVERTGELESVLNDVMARDGHRDRYPSIEEKAAQLLWLVVHQAPFVEGNLCVGAFLFVWFLQRNSLLRAEPDRVRVPVNALVPMVLLIQQATDEQRGSVTRLIASMVNREN